jgi:hypothetical protein
MLVTKTGIEAFVMMIHDQLTDLSVGATLLVMQVHHSCSGQQHDGWLVQQGL